VTAVDGAAQLLDVFASIKAKKSEFGESFSNLDIFSFTAIWHAGHRAQTLYQRI